MIGAVDADADGERAVSELASVVTLVGLAVLLTVGIGVNVLLIAPAGDGVPSANFSFEYNSQGSSLIVTHKRGDNLTAGQVYVVGPRNEANWSALAGWNASAKITVGDRVLVSQSSAYGSTIRRSDRIRVVWRNASANDSVMLDSWSGTSSGVVG